MTKSQKIKGFIFFAVVGGALFISYQQNRSLTKKLNQCSIYTIANISRVYTLRGMAHAVYSYSIDNTLIESDQSINNFDTNESWFVNMDKLKRRRLLIQVYCVDIKLHRIVWDVIVPDTLHNIPVKGWKQKNFN